MDWWLACFFLGAIFSLFSPIVPDIFVLFSLIFISITFFYYSSRINPSFKPFRLSSGLLFGASWMLFHAVNFQQLWQKNNLDALALSSTTQWVQGDILTLHSPLRELPDPLSKKLSPENRIRFNINVTHINNNQLTNALKLRLSWNNATLSLQQGQIVSLQVKFKPAHGLANLGSFSYQTWLNSKQISATGYVVNNKDNRVLIDEVSVRQQSFSSYQQLLPKHDLSPLLLALGFGSRTELSQALWQVLQATGTGHLIAISGLHIGLVATGIFFLFMFLMKNLPLRFFVNSHKIQRINSRYLAIALSMVAALSYGYLAGFSLPTVRALVMLSLYWCSRLLGIKVSIKRWLLLTLFMITLTTPFSLFTASFWLSVYAVIIIFITLWRFKSLLSSGNKLWLFIKGLVVIQLSLTLFLMPISAIFFQQISLVALLANIIAVPWMSVIVIPLCLLSVLVMLISPELSQVVIFICLESIMLLWHYLTYLSNVSWAIIRLSSFDVSLIVLFGILSVFLIFFQATIKLPSKAMSITLMCAIFFLLMLKVSDKSDDGLNNWQLVVFDVGQGLSILVKRDDNAILYDTGAAYKSGFNMVDAVILPYLQYSGITQLDKVIISHSDNDHAGGLAILKQSIAIKELIYNVDSESGNAHKNSHCIQGREFYWQKVKFEFLWPDSLVGDNNDDSCVLLISDKNNRVLLTGDISRKVERKLVEQYPQLQAEVLVVPHHGSKTSSSDAFISHVNPKLAIVSAGYLNRWRMPVTEVVERYQSNNIEMLNSATSGQIVLDLSEKGITQYTYHEDLWPFWFANSL
ncbi:DNA internalization-related competence protein ComEC/Rec2 [Colwellia sp. 4_MG-2023]|jgi:competence protein ComEC|uniref:DNA internalization-related competence protein ComEC/Rec2 n=1 Tax=unclassified Colwellia TaxID=196834 RepID=UPI001C097F18|nr:MULTISPECIES: DNA internalization-related competence protein ComEC/Rec2 [unclassified Colwellia]MBU2925732.1 DNA internalization-related competence protein ComEC/Rec2 [Colwellia sp. C2M11]MDO6505618.1 DNA internalization-related competence protein ComEC/Rec2 [Colwellia sp. 5_MG-2023]MDO6554086.1 DNA internalization-related competence protein ComEC/Rec2 [Colwellia sp. 4_MG-2023]MDO6651042.1 DNA internalization-related competence protein ComEC/Rec2 [Colwellia sp. 3_MG-2023]MDO6664077.1 DNA in